VIRNAAVALALAATLSLSACGGGEPTDTSSSTPPASSTSASATPTESTFTGTEIVVTVANGKVSPPTHRVKVAKGTQVRLQVTSDKADELHVHGYDLEKPLPAGEQVTLEFTADQAGLFDIELHESDLQLAQLEVR
jgi:copper(I)-binding protein